MIAIRSKNLSLLLSPKSFVCNSIVHFSTRRLKRLTPRPEIYDLLVHKHRFSPELVSLVSPRLHHFKSPERVDSILSFLKENSFTISDLEKLVLLNPRVLGISVEGIKSRFGVFQDFGLSSEDIVKIVMCNKGMLGSSTVNRIIPSLSKLKNLLPSDEHVAQLLKKLSWFVTSNLERTLIPNMEIMKSCGVPEDRVLHFLYVQPRCFLVKPVIMRKSLEKVIEIGASHSTNSFIHAVSVRAFMSEGIWEIKVQTLRDMGFSDNDVFTMFRKAPLVFSASTKKIKSVIELVLSSGKYNISNIASYPIALGYSIEKRLEPRLQILGLLESRNLIEKWPGLSSMASATDDKFFERFIVPYMYEIGEECVTKKYVEGIRNESLR